MCDSEGSGLLELVRASRPSRAGGHALPVRGSEGSGLLGLVRSEQPCSSLRDRYKGLHGVCAKGFLGSHVSVMVMDVLLTACA